MREFRGLAAGHGSRISLVRATGEVPHAIGDEQRVQQIGRALLDNAIRHNPNGIRCGSRSPQRMAWCGSR